MPQETNAPAPRYSRRKGIDSSIFREVQKPAPSINDLSERYRREAEKAVANVLRREGLNADYNVLTTGKRVVIELKGVAQELIYSLCSLIVKALSGIQQTLFGTKRFAWHHTVVVNGQRLAFSS